VQLRELEFELPRRHELAPRALIEHFRSEVLSRLSDGQRPIRFVVTETRSNSFFVELSVIDFEDDVVRLPIPDIFEFLPRGFPKVDRFVSALLIPTGIGAEIGGHSGDGNPVARLIAAASDDVITHPNVLNAADINEMTDNTLYVEGSIISRLLMGQVGLGRVRSNRVSVLMDCHPDRYFNDAVVNAASSARVTLGLNCRVHEMSELVETTATLSKAGRASARVLNFDRLVRVVEQVRLESDAIALATRIHTPEGTQARYFSSEDHSVNPWGGAEAMLTHALALAFGTPVAHAPMSPTRTVRDLDCGVVDPRKAPEALSITYLHSVLKGLARHPQVLPPGGGIGADSVSCLIVPDGVLGLPVLAALAQGIPVVVVTENKNLMRNDLRELFGAQAGVLNLVLDAQNYLEAAGLCSLLKSGVDVATVRRPIARTSVERVLGP